MALQISIGCDPEVVLRDKKSGEFVSAHNLLPGTKNEPHKVGSNDGYNGAVQVDGVAAEFNTTPAYNASQFSTGISSVMGHLQGLVGDKYELVSVPSVVFKEDYFKSLPDHVRELGCNPDFDPYTGQPTVKPDGASTTMRTFAGHVHIGGWYKGDPTDETHFHDCQIIAKNLDYYLGLFSLQWDSDTSRRSLYGKAGCFRPKPYGIEYRPLSNVWLRTPQLQQWVFNAAYKCIADLMIKGIRTDEVFGDIARDVINESQCWWTPEGSGKSKDLKKLFTTLNSHTGLKNPPPLPKDNPVLDAKTATKPSPKFKYKNKMAVVDAASKGDISYKEAGKILNEMDAMKQFLEG